MRRLFGWRGSRVRSGAERRVNRENCDETKRAWLGSSSTADFVAGNDRSTGSLPAQPAAPLSMSRADRALAVLHWLVCCCVDVFDDDDDVEEDAAADAAADEADDPQGDDSDGINGCIDDGMDDCELLPDDAVGVAGRKAGACGNGPCCMPALII